MSGTADIGRSIAAVPLSNASGAMVPGRDRQPYPPLRDYALIGDCHGAALVCRDGGIDWCCLGRFDAPPSFARLLDAERGGHFSLAPVAPAASTRRYLDGTAVLATQFANAEGRAEVIDFMPVGCRPGTWSHDYTSLNAPGWLVRIVRGVAGRVRFRAVYRPIAGFFGPRDVPLHGDGRVVAGGAVPALHGEVPFGIQGNQATADFTVGAGETRAFLLAPAPLASRDVGAMARRLLDTTVAFWREWLAYCRYRGPHAEAVRRSAITLKLLTYAPTGAIVAAPTTSLPEAIGGVRNWDYRLCWLRDSSFAISALAALGYAGEARRYIEFLRERHIRHAGVHLMYGITGETDLGERHVDDFAGYRGSRPVRVGNDAHKQHQYDIYGEILDLALLYKALGGRIDAGERAALRSLADHAAEAWCEPDNGIWESRAGRRHFVQSKIECWVAVDRAIRLFGPCGNWLRARREIVEAVRRHGTDARTGSLVQSFGGDGADAALLMPPWLDFPMDEDCLQRTMHRVLTELRDGDYLRRYTVPDGLEGQEGAFLMASFWLADALLFLDRPNEAYDLVEGLLGRANDVGLFAEEIDPRSHAFLGNMPQAFVHIALIHSVLHQELYRRGGRAAIAGSHADRARRHSEAAAGLGAFWTSVRRTLRVGRIGSSSRSVLWMH